MSDMKRGPDGVIRHTTIAEKAVGNTTRALVEARAATPDGILPPAELAFHLARIGEAWNLAARTLGYESAADLLKDLDR